MDVIIGLPGVIAAIYLLSRTPARAFINVYLPVLFFLPNYYRWAIEGLPDPTFSEAAIIPITAVAVFRLWRVYRFSITDLAILLYAGITALAEYQAKGFADAENLLFDVIATCIAPYFLAKLLIEREGLRVKFAKQFVSVLMIIAFIGIYELIRGDHPLVIIWEKAFPDHPVWGEQFRYGLARTKLTFGGSILAATIYSVGALLQFWLIRTKKWARKERLFPWFPVQLPEIPVKTVTIVTVGVLMGLLMPDSRGPLVGAIAAFVLVAVGQARNIRRSFAIWTPVLLLLAYAGSVALEQYSSVSRSEAATAEQETAAYRHDLLIHYTEIVQERPLLGWGAANFPVVEGQWSIDNEYLLLALSSGWLGLGSFCLVLLVSLCRIFACCVLNNRLSFDDRRFALALGAGIVSISISVISVFLGEQVYIVLFLIVGWAEGCVVYRRNAGRSEVETAEPAMKAALPFRYVVR